MELKLPQMELSGFEFVKIELTPCLVCIVPVSQKKLLYTMMYSPTDK